MASASAPWDGRFFEAPAREVLEAARGVKVAEGAAVVVLFEERRVSFEADGRVHRRYRRAYQVLAEAAVRDWSETEAEWDAWHEDKPSLRARVITKEGRVHVLDPRTIEVGAGDDRDQVVYSDSRTLRAPLPAVAVGAVVEEEIAQDGRPLLPGAGESERWYVGGFFPVLRSRLVLEAPRGMPLHVMQRPSAGARPPARAEEGERVRLTFEAGPLEPAPEPEADAPGDVPVVPYVGYAAGAAAWSVVAARYGAAVEKQIAGGDLAALVREVRRDAPASPRPRDLVARLVARLHEEVRYTGVEFGEAAIVPRAPREVLDRRYGDCKDKAAFLVALLRAAGVRAHVALLRASGSDLDPELPGMSWFNHAIVFVPGLDMLGRAGLWIDPTDPFSPVGELPLDDQGRLALVADTQAPASTTLVRIPRAPAEANRVVERREIALGEEGGARVVEHTEAVGAPGRDYRAHYGVSDRKKVEETLGAYAKSQYDARALTRFEHGDPNDLGRPFVLDLEAAGSKMGVIEEDGARVFLRVGALFDRLPDSLRPADEDDRRRAAEAAAPRRADFVIDEPYVYEIRYHVVPPHGFEADTPPADETRAVGTGKLSFAYAVGKAGAVDATIRYETGKARLNPAELGELRAALKKVYESDEPVVGFRQRGQAHLGAGRVREALAEFRRLDAEHPAQALHATQIALALLRAGLGDEARRQARAACAASPGAPLAHRTLGWILEHDLMGRRFKRGADLAGAETAYRKALAIDANDQIARASLAILLERDADGRRTYPRAHLDELGRLYVELHEANLRDYDLNRLIVLLYRERFDEVIATAASLKVGRAGQGPVLAAIAARRGVPAALKEAATRVPRSSDERRSALQSAANELTWLRRYPAAAALYAEAAHGASNASELRALADRVARTRRREETRLDLRRPEAVFRGFTIALLGGELVRANLWAVAAPYVVPDLLKDPGWEEALRAMVKVFRAGLSGAMDLPANVLADMMASDEVTVDGDAAAGFRVAFVNGSGAAFLVSRPEGPRIVAVTPLGSVAGAQALRLLQAGDAASARRWLDWAIDSMSPGQPGDPLSGAPVARLWSPGGVTVDRARAERAAWALVASGPSPEPALAPLERCRREAPTEGERLACLHALAIAARTLHRPDDEVAATAALPEAAPGSFAGFHLRAWALKRAGHFVEMRKVAEAAVAGWPDLEPARLMLADALVKTGEPARAEALLRRYAESTRRRPADLNDLAWLALCRGDVGAATLEAARHAVELDGRRNPDALNTLASVLAERDAPDEAREILLESFDRRGDDGPTSYDWYVVGRIAEGYGVKDAALAAYARVEKPAEADPIGPWVLADRRVRKLRGPSPSLSPRTAGRGN